VNTLLYNKKVFSVLFLCSGMKQVWRPVYQAYRSSYINLDFSYKGVGSGTGVERFKANEYDFAGSDAELSESAYVNNSDYQMFPTMAR
jgi:ABC-type phosphate transport system substrate-binding protein